MKIVAAFGLISILICSCRNVASDQEVLDNTTTGGDYNLGQAQEYFPDANLQVVSEKTMTRHEEVIKIMYDDTTRPENGEYRNEPIKPGEDSEIIYELCGLTGPGSVLRGPLTKEQVEKESLEGLDPSDARVPYIPFAFLNEEWKEFSSQYRERDEFYFHRSNYRTWANLGGRDMYILIRKNEYLGGFVTRFN